MCLGIPGQLVERTADRGGVAWGMVEFAGVAREVCLGCVPDAVPGDFVIVHAGLAISRVDADDAERIFQLLREWEPDSVDEIRR